MSHRIPLSNFLTQETYSPTEGFGTMKLAMSGENLFMLYGNNKGTNQPAHL